MQLLGAVFCFCVIVQIRATGTESGLQERDATKGAEVALKPEPLPAKDSGIRKVVLQPGHLLKPVGGFARTGVEGSSNIPGKTEILDHQQMSVAGSEQPDGDPRLKRSPHRRFKGCYFCGHGGGGFYPPPVYVQPVYTKPVYVQPVYVKPVVYSQPVYSKPVYSRPHYSPGCSTCGQWGGGSGSFSYSQSSASSSSYSYGG